MRTLILIASTLLIAIATGCASLTPEEKAQKQAEKVARKEAEAKADSAAFVMADRALKNLDFVLEANYVTNRYGKRIYVTSNTNFISVTNGRAVVQISPAMGGGPNGVGGLTMDGAVSNREVKNLKNGQVQVSFQVTGAAISAAVTVTLIPNSNYASATVNPNFNSMKVSLEGKIVLPGDSEIYQGRTF